MKFRPSFLLFFIINIAVSAFVEMTSLGEDRYSTGFFVKEIIGCAVVALILWKVVSMIQKADSNSYKSKQAKPLNSKL